MGADWEHNTAAKCVLLRCTAPCIPQLNGVSCDPSRRCRSTMWWTVADTLAVGSFHRPSTILDTA